MGAAFHFGSLKLPITGMILGTSLALATSLYIRFKTLNEFFDIIDKMNLLQAFLLYQQITADIDIFADSQIELFSLFAADIGNLVSMING